MKRFIFVITLIWVGGVLFADEPPVPVWSVCEHIPLSGFIIQCHRGAGNLSAENSMAAFEIAWGLGTIPEADIRMTKDGSIVSFHDNNFARILPDAPIDVKEKGIADLTIEEVAKLDIGAWKGKEHAGQRVAMLTEIVGVLKKYPKRRMYIDIKKVDFGRLAEETIDVHSQLILASTNYDEIKSWKGLAPRSYTLHWMGGTEKQLSERLEKIEKVRFVAIDQLQIHVRLEKDGTLSPSETFLRKTRELLRKYGVLFQVLPWDGSDPAIYKRLLKLGCASFATDYPEATLHGVREFYSDGESRD